MAESSIISQIEHDFVEAYKAKDDFKVSTLRMLKSAIKNLQIDLKEDASDADLLQLIKKEAKQRREAISQYQQGGRNDLADKEQKEVDLLQSYLPQQMGEEEIKKLILQELDVLGITQKKDFGRAMGAIMKKLQGQADGSQVSQILNATLKND